MRALVIGSGGREHAIAWRMSRDGGTDRVDLVPGNAGAAVDVACLPGNILDPAEMASLAEYLGSNCTVVGPEAPLAAGVADEFLARGLPIVGPSRAAALLEASKAFAKEICGEAGVPTAEWALLEDARDIPSTVGRFGYPVALKADGLAAGKGVVIARDESEACAVAADMLAGRLVGAAGSRVVVERFLEGDEVSFMVLSDGRTHCALPVTRDHKRALDGDRGPNTGGMGAYCDDGIIDAATRGRVVDSIVEPVLACMRARGAPFRGFLYCGLMLSDEGPQVLEFNVRLGDPETQPLLYRLEGGFTELLASAARGELDSSLVEAAEGSTACVVVASGGYPGKYATGLPVLGLRHAAALGAKVFHAGTRLASGVPVTSGGRVLGVTARGGSLREALNTAYAATREIRFEGAHYRTDIGRSGLRGGNGGGS